jgi:intein/homing endonuclease
MGKRVQMAKGKSRMPSQTPAKCKVPEDIKKELIKGIIHIARHKEFYGHVIQQFQKVYVRHPHRVDTACVGRFPGEKFIKLWLNLDFFESFYEKKGKDAWNYVLGAEEHEILNICFPAGTMVSGSFKPIEELVKGSPVIGSDGNCHPAIGVMSRDYDGRLVKIKATGVLDFESTENHPVLVADIGWKTINTSIPRCNIRLIRSIDWKKSQDVKRGDWLAVPKLKGFRDDSFIDLTPHFIGNKWSISEKIRDGKLPLNEDTAWLMGYYCAEGSSDIKGGNITFSMHRKEEETLGIRVQSVVNQWIGSMCYASYRSEGGMVVGFSSVLLARMFKDKIGKNASTKRVPDEIFWHRDDRIVKAFLRGYFDGDGTPRSKLFSCATVSQTLAYQVQALFARFGIWMPMVLDPLSEKPARVIVKGPPRKAKDQYKLISNGDEARMLLGYQPVEEKVRKTKHYVSNDDFVFVRVKKVSSRQWSGAVYNLTSPTEDYLVNNVVVHNCSGHLTLHFDDRVRGNVAVDCAVNSHLLENQIAENWPTAEMYGFPKGKAAVWYYNNLKGNAKFQQQCKSGAFGLGGMMEWLGKSHQGWDELEKDPVAKEFVKDIMRKAKELCGKNYGNIPSDIIEMIEELLKRERPVIPWNHVLRMFCASAMESVLEYTMRRESKRYGTRPGTRKGDVLNLAVCVDTSGSISSQQLQLFFNEIRWIWKNGAIISIVEADCSVAHGPYAFKGKWNGEVHGRGGTDLEPALALVEGKYDACIYFTDFYAPPVSRVYRIPTLWVLTTELEKDAYPAQWGRHIKIEDGHAVAG